ncbi:unnamed protein product, partial [Phaeothamnion confervicola]
GAVETWTGGEATRHSWSAWTGATWSPFGKLSDVGWRFRVSGGGGQFGSRQSIYGTSAFADLLIGYQVGIGAVTLKAFAGGTFDGVMLQPVEQPPTAFSTQTGAKGVVETWVNWTSEVWSQVDLAYASVHRTYSGRIRTGYRVMPDVSIGVEVGSFTKIDYENQRVGAFLRYEWLGGEISAAGGISSEATSGAGRGSRPPYGTLVYLTRF